MSNQDNINQIENAATTAIAAVSKTPFMTAFKITMGIAIAHLVIGLLFIGGCAAIGTTAILLVK